jgi:endonuclease III
MAAPGKAQLLNDVHALLKKRYKLGQRPDRLTVLEAVVYGICHEGTTREQANQALSRFKDEFFDWNEVRVSSIKELQGVLAGLPDPEERAQRVRRFLRQLFEKTYEFTLESLLKKPLKDAVKVLQELDAPKSDYIIASVIQQALGGHAIPVDAHLRRVLERLGVADSSTSSEALRSTLERAVPKNRGAEFGDLMEELAHDTCVAGEPICSRCELKAICPTGQARLSGSNPPSPPKTGPKDKSPKDSTPQSPTKPETPRGKGQGKSGSPKDTPAAHQTDPSPSASARPAGGKPTTDKTTDRAKPKPPATTKPATAAKPDPSIAKPTRKPVTPAPAVDLKARRKK